MSCEITLRKNRTKPVVKRVEYNKNKPPIAEKLRTAAYKKFANVAVKWSKRYVSKNGSTFLTEVYLQDSEKFSYINGLQAVSKLCF